MEKLYNIESVLVSDGYLTLLVNGIELKIKLSEISTKLNNASKKDQNNFKISPSGYGIHWPKIDEDLTISGLLKM